MKLKIIMFPDTKVIGDLGTSFIYSSNEQFILELYSIKDPIVMGAFLDSNNHKFIESIKGFSSCDKVIDLSANGKSILEDKSIPIAVKLDTKEYLKFKNSEP